MFARHVIIKLKANSVVEFPRIIESDVLPVVHKQKGFRDEISLLAQSAR